MTSLLWRRLLMAISWLGFNTIALVCLPVKYSRSTTLWSTFLWYFDFLLRRWFVQSLVTLPWEITKIFDWRTNILNQSERSVRHLLKKAPRPCRRFFKLLQPQSPRGFSALARLYYLARPTKTAMLRRLHGNWFSSLELDASGAKSPWRSEEILRKSKIKMPCDKKKYVNLHFWRLTVDGKKYLF